jgi:hypothetical protein
MKLLIFISLIPTLLLSQDPSTFDTVKVNKFITPTKFDHFLYGHETEVKWQKLPDYDRYKLSLSPNGYNWWLTSDSIIGNTYQWQISDMNCDSCQWKVEPYMDEDTRFLKHEWTRTPEPAIKHIEPINLVNTSDSNMVLVGYKREYSENTEKDQTDFYVAKYTTEAKLIWEYEYGDLDSNDRAEGIVETSNGGFIVVGTTESTNQGVVPFGKKDIVAIKLDKDGNKIWRQTYGGKDNDWGFRILPAKDGGYYIGGQTGSSDKYFSKNEGQVDYFIMKIDSEGYMEWSETYGREKDELLDDMQLDPDGNIILFGFSNSRDSVIMEYRDMKWEDKLHPWVLKIDTLGNEFWNYQYGRGIDRTGKMTVLRDGSIIIYFRSIFWSEYISGYDGHSNWALKIDKNGMNIFTKEVATYDLISYNKRFINSRYNITSFEYVNDYFVLNEVSNDTNLVWSKRLNDDLSSVKSIIETKDHSLVIVGKNKPGELTFQKYTVSPIVLPEFSDKFSVETSQPKFTQDTVWLDLKFISTDVDTVIKDIFCNQGSVTGRVDSYQFGSMGNGGNRITEVIHDDEYLEPGECAGMRINNIISTSGTHFETLYFTKPIQPNTSVGSTLTIAVNVTYDALQYEKNEISFGDLNLKDTSVIHYLPLSNISHFDITIEYDSNSVRNFDIKSTALQIGANSSAQIPILFTPVDTGRIEQNVVFSYRLYGGNFVRKDTITLKGYSIPPQKETTVTDTKEQRNTIYPNPATNSINLSGYAEESIYIYDITGKQVKVAAVESSRIDISNLTTGIYLLKDSNGKVFGKFVKE